MDNKIQIFSQFVDNSSSSGISSILGAKHNKMEKNKKKELIYHEPKTQINSASIGSSNINSISFSLVSNESGVRSRTSQRSGSIHNKSIYI